MLGAGNFGITYQAEHQTLAGRYAAIKEFFPSEWVSRDSDGITVSATSAGLKTMGEKSGQNLHDWGRERFIDEAQALAAIEHKGIVRIVDFFPENGTAYLVMVWEDGEPLSARLQNSKVLPEEELYQCLVQALNALEAVHAQGYLHRDLKPDNLYLRHRDNQLMLIDFGAARQAIGGTLRTLTSILTPGYAPIEQYPSVLVQREMDTELV